MCCRRVHTGFGRFGVRVRAVSIAEWVLCGCAQWTEPFALRKICLAYRRHQTFEMESSRASITTQEIAPVMTIIALAVVGVSGLDEPGVLFCFLLAVLVPLALFFATVLVVVLVGPRAALALTTSAAPARAPASAPTASPAAAPTSNLLGLIALVKSSVGTRCARHLWLSRVSGSRRCKQGTAQYDPQAVGQSVSEVTREGP
eukprot:scaffold167116_cov30-Tisochrysis_lutea.AAC.5